MKFWRSILLPASTLALTLFSACSPGSLFDNGKDQQVLRTPSYRQINRSCTNLNLSAPTLTTDEARTVLKCFNAYGALDPLQKLVDKMSDDQLGSFVQVANVYLLKNPSLLYELEQNFYSQRSDGSLKTSMEAFSTLLQKPEFISGLLQLFDAQSPESKTKVLGIIQSVGAKLDPQTIDEAFTTTLTLTSSKAYRSLETNLHSSQNPQHSLQDLTDIGFSILKDSQVPGNYSLIDDINQLTKSGDFGMAMDRLFGTDEATIRTNTPTFGALFPVLSQNDGEYFRAAGGCVRELRNGLHCFDNTQIGLDPMMDVFEEIANGPVGQGGNYLQQTHLLRLAILQPLCTYSPTVIMDYPAVQRMAGTTAMQAIENIVRLAYNDKKDNGSRPIAESIRRFLMDPKTAELTPLMDEFARRDGWQDFMLFLAQPSGNDRTRFANTLAFFADPNPTLNGESVKDSLADVVLEAGPSKAYGFLSQISATLDQDTDWLNPILTQFQISLDQSGAHPYLDFLRSLMTDAPKNAPLFQTLFAISSQPEFNPTIQLFSTLAKDGRLTEILADVVVLMHGHAQEGIHPLPPINSASRIASPRRHNLSSSDLAAPQSQTQLPTSACAQVNIGQSPDTQWHLIADCIAAQGGYADLKTSVNFLSSQKTDTGETELQLISDQVRDLGRDLNHDTYQSLSDWLVSSLNNGDLNRILSGASETIHRKIIRPLFDFAQPFVANAKAKSDLKGLENYVAQILRSPSFPTFLTEIDHVSTLKPEPSSHYAKPTTLPGEAVVDSTRIKRWVENKECENNPDPSERETQILRDYEEGVTPSDQVDQQPKFSWSLEELKTFADPFLAKIADPSQSVSTHTIKDGLLGFLHYFSLTPKQKPNALQHETSDYLEQWFYDRATDQKLITYYYLGDPPDAKPHVRLVSSLDRLEFILSNADFDASVALEHVGIHLGVNLGKYSMTQLADSWGDEPREMWPEEIKAKYRSTNPPTLEQTIDHIMGMLEWMKDAVGYPTLPHCEQQTNPEDSEAVQQEELNTHPATCQSSAYAGSGFPLLPGCLHMPDTAAFDLRNDKRRLYNLAQVASVLRDNLPNSASPQAGGLKVLRDLFYQLHYSTPVESRGQLEGMKNNLSLIRFFVDSGITRQLSFELRRYQRNDPALRDAVGALVAAGNTPEASGLFNRLLVQDSSRTLIWQIAEKLYPYMGNSIAEGKVRKDSLYFKQSVFEGLALLQRWSLVEPALKAVNQILDEAQGSVQTQIEDLIELVSNTDVSHLLAGLSQDKNSPGKKSVRAVTTDFLSHPELISNALGVLKAIDSNPNSRESIKTIETRWDEFRQSAEYRSLQLGELKTELADYFEEGPGMSAKQVEAARALRVYLAQRLENGDVDDILRSFASSPERSEQTFETLAHYIDSGSITDFFAFVRLSVDTPAP